ncbi:MAG: hypothetical protein LQ352_001770 [Teloschistes flavicans]|nr:MAG: hypothetical protein LQ352_001770 [Teloschistes flavicans]
MYSAILATALTGLSVANAAAPIVPGTTGKLGDAAIVTTNPPGITYTATLPNSTTSDIRGFVAGTSNANGTGVVFNINLSGFPDPSLGPFLYHIHDQPVPANGNCTATLAHQDPYIRGEMPPCDPTQPETCQTGDLAGKHGNITTNPFQTSFLELYLSTVQGPASFFGNRSIVIHTSNTTRLTCANFTLTSGNSSSGGNSTSPSGNGTVAGSSPVPFTGGATASFVNAGAILAGLAAFIL